MNTLTTPIAIQNVTKLRVRRYIPDGDTSEAAALIEASGPGNKVYESYTCQITNGACQGIRANATPVTLASDVVQKFTATVATGYTDLTAAFTSAGNLATKLRAVETAMIAAGLMPAGVVS